ncbi:MAG: DUF6498-containing protein, partial [bacterium]
MNESKETKRNIFSDISLWVLLISNLVTIIIAILEGWNLITIMWVYWFQSASIGVVNFIRILNIKWISNKGFKSFAPYEKAT